MKLTSPIKLLLNDIVSSLEKIINIKIPDQQKKNYYLKCCWIMAQYNKIGVRDPETWCRFSCRLSEEIKKEFYEKMVDNYAWIQENLKTIKEEENNESK